MNHKDFLFRLENSLGERKKYPFGAALGFSRGTVNRIFSGEKSGSIELFMALRHYENLSLDWLINGIGQQYITRPSRTDRENARMINDFFEGEPLDWKATIVTDQQRNAVVLTQPDRYRIGDRSVDYIRVELMTGPVGTVTLDLLDEAELASRSIQATDEITMERLLSGQIGIYSLLQKPGILLKAEQRSLFSAADIAEPAAFYNSAADLSLEEIKLLGAYRKLTADDRRRLDAIAEALRTINAPDVKTTD